MLNFCYDHMTEASWQTQGSEKNIPPISDFMTLEYEVISSKLETDNVKHSLCTKVTLKDKTYALGFWPKKPQKTVTQICLS